jgi:hypothetical protein
MNESEFLSLAERSIGELGLELSLDTGRPFVAAVGVLMVDNPREFARAVVARLRHRLGDAWGDLLDDGAAILNPPDSPMGYPAEVSGRTSKRLVLSDWRRVTLTGWRWAASSRAPRRM